jgi:hypothetical protein
MERKRLKDENKIKVLCEFGKVMQPQTVTAATLEQEHLRALESHPSQGTP